MTADHKKALFLVKETNVRHPMDEVELIKAAYLELRELAKAVASLDEYETEYDGRMISLCIGCGNNLEMEGHAKDCPHKVLRAAIGEE